MPLPARAIWSWGLEAFDATEMVPATDPLVVGAKATPNVKLCPGVKVTGRPKPLMLKAFVLALACVIVTLEPPEFVSDSDNVCVPPTRTLPKLRLGAAALSDPAVAAPVPTSGMVRLAPDPLVRMVTLPIAAPLDWGVKVTLKVAVRPQLSMSGKLGPLTLNPLPAATAWLMTSLP